MPHVITFAMTSCMQHATCAYRQAGHPYDYEVCQKLLIDLLLTPAEQYL